MSRPKQSKKPSKNLTLSARVLQLADEVMKVLGQGNLSAFVEQLIRDEYEKRFGMIGAPGCKHKAPSETPATVSEIQSELDRVEVKPKNHDATR